MNLPGRRVGQAEQALGQTSRECIELGLRDVDHLIRRDGSNVLDRIAGLVAVTHTRAMLAVQTRRQEF